MEHKEFYQEVFETLQREYVSAVSFFKEWQDLQWIISPFVIRLPQSIYDKADQAIKALWNYSRSDIYRQSLPHQHAEWLNLTNDSVLMAYDFHSDKSGEICLIEVNTNASGYLTSSLAPLTFDHHDPRPALLNSFVNEWSNVFASKPLSSLIITDQNIETQKMLFEFYMFQDLFKKQGWSSTIEEWSPTNSGCFIYNRHTDFYLEQPNSQNVKQRALERSICLSPSPKEYFLLADKQRMAEWCLQRSLLDPTIQRVLLDTFHVAEKSKDEIWSARKKLFFKPRQSYGGKSVYKGASVTKKIFDRILAEDFLAQELFPPGRFQEEWKFDLRFYVYKNTIQFYTARLYQGQLTNFKTPLGGYARVEFVS